MARIKALESGEVNGWLKLLYWFGKRQTGKLTGLAVMPEPARVLAHQPRLLVGLAQMEMAQLAVQTVPATLKSLASIKTALMVGCPF